MNKKLVILCALLSTIPFVLVGCNLFGWTSSDNADSLISEGIRDMRDGEYDAALSKFAKAMEQDPNSSEARYYHAKAAMSASGFNSFNLGVDMTQSDDDEAVPFTGSNWPNDKAEKLNSAILTVYNDLKPIYEGKTTGSFTRTDIDLDFGITVGIRGLLLFQDVNMDGLINSDDYEFHFVSGADGNFGFGPGDILGYLEMESGSAKIVGTAANDTCEAIAAFNMLLDSIDVIISESRDIITQVVSEESDLSPDEIDALLAKVVLLADNWKINDPADNDGDGTANEEIINLVDDDGDGYYDEDGWWASCVNYTP